jgi:hypothetical protein
LAASTVSRPSWGRWGNGNGQALYEKTPRKLAWLAHLLLDLLVFVLLRLGFDFGRVLGGRLLDVETDLRAQ